MSNIETQAAVTLTKAEKIAARVALLTERIGKDTAELAEITRVQETQAALGSIEAGTPITVRQGRAETTREVQGTVRSVHTVDDEVLFIVEIGEGLDLETIKVRPHQIVQVGE